MSKIWCWIIPIVLFIVAVGCLILIPRHRKVEPETTVETYINADRNYMHDVSPTYVWFETQIHMTGEVDTLDSPSVKTVNNVFQVYPVDTTVSPSVYQCFHSGDEYNWDIREGHWLDDIELNTTSSSIITFAEAFNKLKESNGVLPKSAFCTLRRPLGPKIVNPQYIFGNDSRGVACVDAITGEVKFNSIFE